MKYEWNEHKNRANSAKHGIDFETATNLWSNGDRVEIQTTFSDENRRIMIGRIEKKLWAAIFTKRGNAIRIISVRRARKKETELYENKK